MMISTVSRPISGAVLELDLSTADAFKVGERLASWGEFGFLDEHVGDVVDDLKFWSAAGADEGVAFEPEGGFTHGANEDFQEVVGEHGAALSGGGAEGSCATSLAWRLLGP
jgi:hypothetical protein